MKRTNRLTTFVSIILFIVVLLYVGIWAWRSFSGSFQTTEAVTGKVSVGGTAEGIVIRTENLLSSDEPYIDITTEDGDNVSAGSTVATAMSSEAGLTRAARIETLEKSIELTSSALGEDDSGEATVTTEAAEDLVKTLTRSVARGEVSDIESTAITLSSSILADNGASATAEELAEMKQELQSLESSSSSDTYDLTTEVAGIFTSNVDGYEYLSYDDIRNLTPSKLQELMDKDPKSTEGNYGKVISDIHWYYACVMDSSEADSLSVGEYVGLDFGRYYAGTLYGKVVTISTHEDGKTAVVFKFDEALRDTLDMRSVSAQVVLDTYEGVRIPARAVHYDETDGTSYVFTVTALKLERKDVTIIYADDDWCIVKRETEGGSLREGNEVVVNGKNLYDGKIVD